MSVYHFTPCPDLSTREQVYATWNDGFSTQELDSIVTMGDALAAGPATVAGAVVDKDIRESSVGWIVLSADSRWLYDRLTSIVRKLNGQFFDFDLYGFVEDFQYTVYGVCNAHYSWHMDKGAEQESPRKLSMVLQLSDPSEYDGGDLELMPGMEVIRAERKRGLVHVFPSWVLHRVTPVTRGVRKTVVVWVTGPKFK